MAPNSRYAVIILICLFQMTANSVFAQPKAGFTFSAVSGCSPLTENFTDATTGGTAPYSYSWDLGNTNTSTLQDPGAIYYTPGTYIISLKVTDARGKSDTISKSITVFRSPIAGFSSDTTSGCPPLYVKFKDTSRVGSGNIVTWAWDFGDGSSSALQNPSHQYTNSGYYNVSLQVTDKNGCTSFVNMQKYIYIDEIPVVTFSAAQTSACAAPFAAYFTSSVKSTSSVRYLWHFGDGATGTGPSPTHTYGNTGYFTVTLTCTNALGCTGSTTMIGYIYVGKPKAAFAADPSAGCAPLTVKFTDNTYGSISGTTYFWDLGDGSTTNAENTIHTYKAGVYTVKLVVTNPTGCADTLIMPGLITAGAPYKASFTADSILCNSPNYYDKFVNTSGINTHVVAWNFGDSVIDSANSFTNIDTLVHSFPPGTFTIAMTVKDQNGCLSTIRIKKRVIAGPTVAIIYIYPDHGCAPLTVSITNSSISTDSIVGAYWIFGDGTVSYAMNPGSHTYVKPGIYWIKLQITTRQGCISTDSVEVKVGQRPHADFYLNPNTGCLNHLRHMHLINLTNTYPVKADSFAYTIGGRPFFGWKPGNVNIDIYMNDTPGQYDITLVAYYNGCTDTMKRKKYITVYPPWAYYTPHVDSCLRNIVSFKDASIGASRVVYYFGDGDSSTQRNPTHTYLTSGFYYPIEVVFDSSNGCSDTFSYYNQPPLLEGLYIRPPWYTSLKAISRTTGCAPFLVGFKIYDNDTSNNMILFGDGDTASAYLYGLISKYGPDTVQKFYHSYTKPGKYQAVLVSTSKYGCVKKDTLSPMIVVQGLNAGFIASPDSACAPLKVRLIDTSSNSASYTSRYYLMGNGDQVLITSDTMYYTYMKPPPNQKTGYTITLVEGNSQCTDYANKTVYPIGPTGQLYAFNNSSCDSVKYQFIPVGKGIWPMQFLWDFGNKDTTLTYEPWHTFLPGNYRVKLKITDSTGCSDTISYGIDVPVEKDMPDFNVVVKGGTCPPFTAYFTDGSQFSLPGKHYFSWDFGDGSGQSTVENPTRTYDIAGSYNVRLTIRDELGCTASIVKNNIINIKGPTGQFSFDRLEGCTPLLVHFKGSSNYNVHYVWDFGDGSLGNTDSAAHLYTLPNTYIPSLLLKDSSGCLYSLPPKDSIKVYAIPVPAFGYDSICAGMPMSFRDQSTVENGEIVQWYWELGDGDSSHIQNPQHIYKKNGYYTVKLTATSSKGCSNTIIRTVKYGDIIAGIKAPRAGCLRTPVQFKDMTVSDSAIKTWFWLFGDGTSSTLQNPAHTYARKGVYAISLYVSNYKGCTDTLKDGALVIIGDTVNPPVPALYRVSVIDDRQTEIDFNADHNFDFEKYLLLMEDETGKITVLDSILNANDTIYFAHGLNNLHHSYCFMVQAWNVCGYRSTANASYHCSINLGASPAVNQAVLNWKPYQGWPVDRYLIYRQNEANPPQFLKIDSVPGTQFSYTDTSVVCYKPMNYRVLGVENGGYHQVSWSDTAATIPIHVPHVPQAVIVRATVENNKSTRVEWENIPRGHVNHWLLEKSADGVNFHVIDTPIVAAVLAEDDQKVDVQNNSYTYRLQIIDSCGDIGPYSNIGKTILLHIDTTADEKPSLVWNRYNYWPEGVQYYDIEIENAAAQFNWLARTNNGVDTSFVDKITDLNSLPFYIYRVIAHRNGPVSNPNLNIGITSMSNNATLKPRSCLYIPNAFTPNGDGLNDSFFVQGLFIKEFHMKIFDRWGTRVFESNNMNQKWGGTYKGGQPIMDAYKYLIYYTGVDDEVKYLNGWVTILE